GVKAALAKGGPEPRAAGGIFVAQGKGKDAPGLEPGANTEELSPGARRVVGIEAGLAEQDLVVYHGDADEVERHAPDLTRVGIFGGADPMRDLTLGHVSAERRNRAGPRLGQYGDGGPLRGQVGAFLGRGRRLDGA